MFKKILKKASLILLIIVLGGLGGILADRYLFPYLASTKMFSKYEFLKKTTEDVTIINKTEQVYVKEETSITKITGTASSSVVNIVSYPKKSLLGKTESGQTKNGTGLIVTSDGLIMTYSQSIIGENSAYKVLLSNGSSFDAQLVGVDSYSNLAFLKIDANNLPAASFGNSDDSQPGEKVIAIGNSFGNYENRYAAGLLGNFNPTYSLSGKTVSSTEKLEGVFGTDFNSESHFIGGPIVDYSGQIIGIIGTVEKNGAPEYFQIPSNKAKRVIERAIKNEISQDPYLGAYYMPLDKSFALANNLSREEGALIYSPSGQASLAIIVGSPAQKAGLQLGDIITAVNDKKIDIKNSFSDTLYNYKKGDEIELSVARSGKDIKIKVQL